MRIRKRTMALVATGGLLAFGLVTVSASASWACTNGTGSYGGACQAGTGVQQQATLVIPESLSFSTDAQPFTLDESIGVDVFSGGYHAYLKSNNIQGISLWMAGPPSGEFSTTASCATNCSISDQFVSSSTIGSIQGSGTGTSGGCANAAPAAQSSSPLQPGGAQFNVLDDLNSLTGNLQCAPSTPTGYDSFSLQGSFLSSLPTLPAGSYTGALTLSAWGD